MMKINFKDLIINIIKIFTENNIGFGRTRLIKIAYLVELEYYRANKERITDAEWIFYKYGPYPINYNDYLEQNNIIINDEEDVNFQKISIKDYENIPSIPVNIKILINSLIIEFGKITINELLNYIYFNTEPMIDAIPKQKLDFTKIKTIEKKKININYSQGNLKKLDKIKKELKTKLLLMPKNDNFLKNIPEDIFESSDIKNEE